MISLKYIRANLSCAKKSLKKRSYLFTASDRFDELTDRIRAVKSKRFKYVRNYNIEKPHALNVVYRTQMNLMKHLNELNKSNSLSDKQKLWFQVPKRPEEFYDLENDPFELNNLIEDEKFSLHINELKLQLDSWLKNINDLGEIPEKELARILVK